MTAVGDGVPTGEDVGRVLAEHVLTGGYLCLCGQEVETPRHWGAHLADVVTALYAPVVEQGARDRAAVERVEQAASRHWHDSRCNSQAPPEWNVKYPCDCWMDDIRAALDVTEPPSEGEA